MAQASMLEKEALRAFAERFTARFGPAPVCAFAPGRVNLIGEHTDYSGGLCMPGAIREGVLVGAARARGRFLIVSETLGAEAEIAWPPPGPRGDWTDHILGVALELQNAGNLIEGADIRIASDLPMGAGVSSSAALEVACAMTLAALAGADMSPLDIAKLSQRAENEFVGAPCGLMDQFASACATGALMRLDCATLDHESLPWPEDWGLFLVDSGVKHAIVDGGYGQRRKEVEAAARHFGGATLREAEALTYRPGAIFSIPEPFRRRARHVVFENHRVELVARALRQAEGATGERRHGEAETIGDLIAASHTSLRDDMEVTCPETEELALIARRTDGVFGARQMGGGFGGNVLVMCDKPQMERAMASILERVAARAGKRVTAFPVTFGPGARRVLA